MKPKAVLLFRNSSYFSIEHLFSGLREELENGITCDYIKLPCPGASLKALYTNLRFGKRLKYDIMHITGDVNYMAFSLDCKKTILTIHDIIHLQDAPNGLKSWMLRKLWYDYPLRMVRFITCISEATKGALLKQFPQCDATKVHVIHDPLDTNFKYAPRVFNSKHPRILFIGTKENKNLPRVIEAMKEIHGELRIIGRLPDNYRVLLVKSGIEWSSVSSLSDEQVREEYINCDMLCFPSIAEGFGLPILEAQATGRPVLTSNCSSMPEVAGKDGAIFVNPLHIDDICNGIRAICTNNALRTTLVETGHKNIKRFLPGKIAMQYLSLYNQILDETT